MQRHKRKIGMENPFIYGIATHGDCFTDREKETERLRMNFTHGINTMIISPRRWGKTSLVNRVAEMLADNEKVKVVRMDAFSCRTEDDFYRLFATEIIKQTSNKVEQWITEAKHFLTNLVPHLTMSTDPGSEISFSLEAINHKYTADVLTLPERIAVEKGISVVVCIDEFQQIADFRHSLSFQKKLRSVWQLQQNTSYCLFGSKRHILMGMFGKSSFPFYRFGDLMFLERIPVSYWTEYIQKRFETTGKHIPAELCEKVCEYVESNSSYVQQMAWLIWTFTTKTATDESFELAQEEIMRQNHVLFQSYIDALTSYQINMIRAIADGHTNDLSTKSVIDEYNLASTANVASMRKSLEARELIEVQGKSYAISDPLFAKWVYKNV